MKRRWAREIAVEALYCHELSENSIDEILEDLFYRYNPPKSVKKFAKRLVDTTISHIEEIDEILKKVLINWDLKRLASLDRNILRMATAEMLYMEDIPPKVSIDEAIELAKKYSTEDSGKFVNGVLDRIYKDYVLKDEDSDNK